MQFTHTINQYTLKEYFFVDGKRVSKSRYDSVRRGKRLNCFLTVSGEKFLRQYSESSGR